MALHKAAITNLVYQKIYWLHAPFQIAVDALTKGHKMAQQNGDPMNMSIGLLLSLQTGFVQAGCLESLRGKIKEVALNGMRQNMSFHIGQLAILHVQFCALIDGLHVLKMDTISKIPGEQQVLAKARETKSPIIFLHTRVNRLARAFFFRNLNVDTLKAFLSDMLSEKKSLIGVFLLFGKYVLFCSRKYESPF